LLTNPSLIANLYGISAAQPSSGTVLNAVQHTNWEQPSLCHAADEALICCILLLPCVCVAGNICVHGIKAVEPGSPTANGEMQQGSSGCWGNAEPGWVHFLWTFVKNQRNPMTMTWLLPLHIAVKCNPWPIPYLTAVTVSDIDMIDCRELRS
jgi:hypothetical protein